MSRFLDERGRIFGKVNVVDILVLLVIIAVVVFAVVRFTGASSETVPLKVTYTVEEVRQATVDAIQETVEVNGTVRDDGGTVLGKVVRGRCPAHASGVHDTRGRARSLRFAHLQRRRDRRPWRGLQVR